MPTGRGEVLPPKGTYTESRNEHAKSLSGTSLVFLEKEKFEYRHRENNVGSYNK